MNDTKGKVPKDLRASLDKGGIKTNISGPSLSFSFHHPLAQQCSPSPPFPASPTVGSIVSSK